jgi:hypothetical protein
MPVVDPFSMTSSSSSSSKENIAPSHHQQHASAYPHIQQHGHHTLPHPHSHAQQQTAYLVAQQQHLEQQQQQKGHWKSQQAGNVHLGVNAHMGVYVRPALHSIPQVGELAIPSRGMSRRLSN